jgi:hypothetical protein
MKKLHNLQKVYTFQAYKMFANNVFSIGVHWGVYIYAEWVIEYWTILSRKIQTLKTTYFGEIGVSSWYY